MRSYGVLHRWFPAYDPALGQYSPGRILLVELAKAAGAHGIGRIDRSKGLQQDKTSFMSGTVDVAEGTVTCRPLTRMLHRTWHGARELARVPVFGTPARLAARASRPLRRRLMFR
jgi:CelD/BcsL family acetyltransferase involved in cellulose biosynthesis